jgi:hypothetical protein
VTSLSDIKEIKDALKKAIEEIRERVREKQARDSKQMAHLAQKVKKLSTENGRSGEGDPEGRPDRHLQHERFERFIGTLWIGTRSNMHPL